MKTLIALIVVAASATAAQACDALALGVGCYSQPLRQKVYIQHQVRAPVYVEQQVVEVPVYVQKQKIVVQRQKVPVYAQQQVIVEKQRIQRQRFLQFRAPLRQKSVRRERVVERQVY